MVPGCLGVVLDSSYLIAAERVGMTAVQAISSIKDRVGEVPIVLSPITVAEIAHGIHRAKDPDHQQRRRAFLDDLKAAIPVWPITSSTAEIAGRIGAEQARKGIPLPVADLLIGSCALELRYAVATGNLRDFSRVPGVTVLSV